MVMRASSFLEEKRRVLRSKIKNMSVYHCSIKGGSKGSGASGTAKALYVCREGKYSNKPDLEGAAWHGNMPTWAQAEPRAFWQAADEYERANARVFTEIEIALPRELPQDERRKLVEDFILEELKGLPYSAAIHNPKAMDDEEQPHAHIIFSERKLDGIEREAEQFFRRANAKEPTKGGAAKDRAWNDRNKVQEVRESWERHHNKAVEWQELYVSCKSLKAQNIDRVPEPKLGPKGIHTPAAERIKATRKNRAELQQIKLQMQKLSREIEEAKTQDLEQARAKAEADRLATAQEKALTEAPPPPAQEPAPRAPAQKQAVAPEAVISKPAFSDEDVKKIYDLSYNLHKCNEETKELRLAAIMKIAQNAGHPDKIARSEDYRIFIDEVPVQELYNRLPKPVSAKEINLEQTNRKR